MPSSWPLIDSPAHASHYMVEDMKRRERKAREEGEKGTHCQCFRCPDCPTKCEVFYCNACVPEEDK